MTLALHAPRIPHWGFALAVALALHAGLAVMLFRAGEPGAVASGIGGVQVGLGPAGGAVGAPSEVQPQEAREAEAPVAEAREVPAPEAESLPPPEAVVPEAVQQAEAVPPPVPEVSPSVPVETAPVAAAETPLYAPVEEIPSKVPEEAPPVVEELAEALPPEEVAAETVPPENALAPASEPEVVMAETPAPPEETKAREAMKTPPKPLAKPRATPRQAAERTPPKDPKPETARAEAQKPEARDTKMAAAAQADPSEGAPQSAALSGNDGKAGSGETSASGTGDGGSGGGVPGAYVDYKAQLMAWLKKHQEYPRRAKLRRQEGAAHLYIAVDASGKLLDYRIDKSAGYKLLDEEVAAMVQRAQPLPAVPEEIDDRRLEFRFQVEFWLR
ncbi:MAG: hypothetical protein Tsb0032_11550 [Kiloniellaceae bacterium]